MDIYGIYTDIINICQTITFILLDKLDYFISILYVLSIISFGMWVEINGSASIDFMPRRTSRYE